MQTMLGVIGDPISHSISPALHGWLIREFALPFHYAAFRVKPVQLESAIRGASALGFRGLNVTMPHKQAVLDLAGQVAPSARHIGAANTLMFGDDGIAAHNTDLDGWVMSLQLAGISLKDRTLYVLGAGGAARAIAFAGKQEKASKIYICNRSEGRAKQLASAVGAEVCRQEAVVNAPSGAIVVNCTTLGMSPNSDGSPLPADCFRPQLVYADLVYTPLETAFLRNAQNAGAMTVDGLGMLILQGVIAMQIWTGRRFDIAEIYPRLRAHLIDEMNKPGTRTESTTP